MTERITIRETVRIKLEESSDPEYREFHSRLLPGITGIMGVRTPELRGIAKDLKKSGSLSRPSGRGDREPYISFYQDLSG